MRNKKCIACGGKNEKSGNFCSKSCEIRGWKAYKRELKKSAWKLYSKYIGR